METIIYLNRFYTVRDRKDPLALHGMIIIQIEGKVLYLPCKENWNYILQSGTYDLIYEYSPKFNRCLWEIKGAEPRTEIKLHEGKRASHSKGCILLRANKLECLHNTLDSSKTYKIKIH